MNSNRTFLVLVILTVLAPLANGALITEQYSFTTAPLPLSPEDGTGAPASDTRLILSSITQLTDVNVSFTLTNPAQAGAYNGDYYVTLQHSSGLAVLLNRVGRIPGSGFSETLGYGDNGFDITFDDQALLGDVHLYQTALGGQPVDGDFIDPLTGTWAPDARLESPLTVVSTDARTSFLSVFNSLDASGTWTLQVLDFNPGGEARLVSWGLILMGETEPVPESTQAIACVGLALVGLVWFQRRRSRAT